MRNGKDEAVWDRNHTIILVQGEGQHDEPYPEDDHSLGEHEDDPDPRCKQCRKEAKRDREW